ncbi:serpin family protein [Neobacillus mesonae]|nr:serpin family protein [Neobacillus mesonae]
MNPFEVKRRSVPSKLILAVTLMLSTSACGYPADSAAEIPTSQTTIPQNMKQISLTERSKLGDSLNPALIESQNALGMKLLEELRKQEGEAANIFLSPYSIATALTLTYNGADGITKQEMAEVLGLTGLSIDEVNEASRIYMQLLNSPGKGVELMTANSVWVDSNYSLKPSFLETAGASYGAEVMKAELSSVETMNAINAWVSERTKGLIEEMLKEPLNDNIVTYLLNALYFKGSWVHTFDESLTKDAAFIKEDGSELRVPMMSDTNLYEYKETGEWQAIRLPYRDSNMNMLVILPAENTSLTEIEQQLKDDPAAFQKSFEQYMVQLSMPKYKIEYEAGLVDTLINLGMPSAFDGGADFSHMSDGGLFIADVQHKAVLEVNEKGSEAAAATSVGMAESSAVIAETKVMDIHRPFFTAIEDRDTGAWLFMGSIYDPSGE